jgi:hypothetical protein
MHELIDELALAVVPVALSVSVSRSTRHVDYLLPFPIGL